MDHGRSAARDRQARIRWEFASEYPGIVAGEWMPAWLLAEKLMAHARQQGAGPDLRRHIVRTEFSHLSQLTQRTVAVPFPERRLSQPEVGAN